MKKRHICDICGAVFAGPPQAKTCSDACRSALHRLAVKPVHRLALVEEKAPPEAGADELLELTREMVATLHELVELLRRQPVMRQTGVSAIAEIDDCPLEICRTDMDFSGGHNLLRQLQEVIKQ